MEQGTAGTVARLEGATKDEVVAMFKKQERVLARYKTRFSEVVTVFTVFLFCFIVVCLFVFGSDLCPYIYMYTCTTTCMYGVLPFSGSSYSTFHVQVCIHVS